MSDKTEQSDTKQQYPPHLYKFRPGSTRNIENLRNGHIWLPTFDNMNDPHDGQLDILIEQAVRLHDAIIPLIIRDPSGAPLFSPLTVYSTPPDNRNPLDIEEKYNLEVKKSQEYCRKLGIYSLSESCRNALMWAHYADNSSGFCIEYSLYNSKGQLHPNSQYYNEIDYVAEYPKIDLQYLKMSSISHSLYQLLGRKEESWKYEKEWRSIILSGGNCTKSHPLPISSIIFGANLEEPVANRIKTIFKGTDVLLKKSIKLQGQFELGVETI